MRVPLALLFAVGLVLGCRGQPVGGKVPRVSPGKAAGVAAGAAALTTLAAPDYAKRQQEQRGDKRGPKTQTVEETVPAGVLDRAEAEEEEKAEEPCQKKAELETVDAKQRPELFPHVKSKLPKPCEQKEEAGEMVQPIAKPANL